MQKRRILRLNRAIERLLLVRLCLIHHAFKFTSGGGHRALHWPNMHSSEKLIAGSTCIGKLVFKLLVLSFVPCTIAENVPVKAQLVG